MNKIKLTGVRNIPTDSEINENKDYAITLIASRDGVYEIDPLGEEEKSRVFHLKVDHVEHIIEIGGHEIKFKKGTTPSQRMRFAVNDYMVRIGKEPSRENYEKYMEKLINMINEKE
jgi:hypothetical protein